MSLQDVFDIVTFVFILGTFVFLAIMMASAAKDAFGEAFGKSGKIERYRGSTGAVMGIMDEKMDAQKKLWMMQDENYELKNVLNEDALKFEHAAASLRDAQNNHRMSKALKKEINAIIRELESFAEKARERAGDAE